MRPIVHAGVHAGNTPGSKLPLMQQGEYVCDACGGEFVSDWTVEEAEAQARELFGSVPAPEDQAMICDPCFHRLMPRAIELGLVRSR